MVNFQFNLASVSGILLAVGGAALYAVRSTRPELSRDHDIFFSAVGLLCGLILIFYGWRFDPIMQFGQVLLTGASIFFVVENLRLRKVSTEQAKKNTPIVDSDRPVSRSYKTTYNAEFDDQEVINDRVSRPRIQGSREVRSERDEYDSRRRPTTRRNPDPRIDSDDRPRRRPRADDSIMDATSESNGYGSAWGADDRSRSRNTPPSSRPRRPRPTDDEASSRRREVVRPSDDYVEYRPIESNDDENDNWGNS
ncbi:Ycf66 family protein [Phormidesmis sp. 146-12]